MTTQIIKEIQSISGVKGRLTFNPEVIKHIAAIVARDVIGIYSISGGIFDGIAERLSNKQQYKGIKVVVEESEVVFDINIIVEYAHSIPDIYKELKSDLKQTIYYMTGLEVVEVNLMVDGLKIVEELNEEIAKD
ncbi:Asp23/Gls24 family envelope stress response protein [Desulfuribacillus alkaliarsenatis]|uniref:Alkaline-shock protein n=1 Tax=Desulfuribacillus alkaliarsenatis TaxID=766136 RepID=A0A1E5G659_9FIRM|nr:Asp23/Gls24 family envelope stress response protein [Desulfuribacillus alkaliarsenatis]OEF98670.1 hypothetical protein BHF68_03145 [Desulfuribacillus alkaliarsenatis]